MSQTLRELRWHGWVAISPRRVWDRIDDGSPIGAWPTVWVALFAPLVIGYPLHLTPALLEIWEGGQTISQLSQRYDGLLVGYLLASALLGGVSAIVWSGLRIRRTPRPYGVHPELRGLAVACAAWMVLLVGALSAPVGPKSERTVIIPPAATPATAVR